MREIVLDTETTGLDPFTGDRIVEIGAVELMNHIPTGRHFHRYVNPERDVPVAAQQVHGLSREFLSKHPTFGEVVADFYEFLGDSKLVIHNAEFDMKFVNFELKKFGFAELHSSRAIDTLRMARTKFPGAPASLDALCKRFNVDLSERKFHGALLDCNLLAAVYIELIGGRQAGLNLAGDTGGGAAERVQRIFRAARVFPPLAEEEEAHRGLIAQIKDALWGSAAPKN